MRKYFEAGLLRHLMLSLFVMAAFFLAEEAAALEKKPVQVSSQEMTLARALNERRLLLEKKEQEVAEKEKILMGLEQEINGKIDKNLALQKELQQALTELRTVQGRQFKYLIKVYSAMSAAKVAPLLDEMTDGDAVAILKAMQAEQVAKIIPKMKKEKAVRISRALGLL